MKRFLITIALLLASQARAFVPSSQAQFMGLTWTPTSVGPIQYGSLSFTAAGGAATGVTVVPAVAGYIIVVYGYAISTDTGGNLALHHQGGAVVISNTIANFLGGGAFAAGGGESRDYYTGRPALAPGQPVCLDISTSMTTIFCVVAYRLVQ